MDDDEHISGDRWRKFRAPNDLWTEFGQLVGDRRRSAEIRAFVEWRTGRPGARLPVPASPRLRRGYVVWVDEEGDDRTVEVHELPGQSALPSEDERDAITKAIQSAVKPPAKRTRKAAK